MALHYHPVRFAGQLEFDVVDSDHLHLVHASGRAAQVTLPADWMTLAIVLAGNTELRTRESFWTLSQGRAMLWCDGGLRIGACVGGWCLLLCGSTAAWRRHLHDQPQHAEALLPFEERCPRPLLRLLARMAQLASRRRPADAGALLGPLCATMLEHQADLQSRLQRCTGRTLQRRRQTLRRLLRVQHLIRTEASRRVDLVQLARSANYSPCHLIRIYREVFGETPSEYAARLRLQRAWQLVRETGMPVCEISEALGFESQSAFCRAFKSSFGITTSEVRRSLPDPGGGARALYPTARAA